jgi:hypothetical protein
MSGARRYSVTPYDGKPVVFASAAKQSREREEPCLLDRHVASLLAMTDSV